MKKFIQFLHKYKQLSSTLLLATFVIVAFLYIANSFAKIAQTALNDSINVRIGAFSDATAPFLQIMLKEPALVREQLKHARDTHSTLSDIQVVQKSGNRWHILYSTQSLFEGEPVLGVDELFEKAVSQPDITFIKQKNPAQFWAARTIEPQENIVLFSKHSLSATNALIMSQVNKTILILFAILAVLIVLFLRHARIIDYATLYQQLKQIDQMKDDFISITSHELRAPLAALRGYLDILESELSNPSSTVKKALDRIKSSSTMLAQLIDDILDVAKIEQGKMKFELSPTNPAPIVQETVEQFAASAKQKGLQLSVNVADNLVLNIDEKRFKQILNNLLSNAIKYTQTGRIDVVMYKSSNNAVLLVKDTGIGMSSQQQAHLFDKFWRAKDKDARSQKGTGLGLWITKQLVEKMGGKIVVRSIKGVGTEFEISFPLMSIRNEEIID